MPPPVACPQCGEELDIPLELRGREVRCAVCRTTFVPAADRPAAPPPTATRNRYEHDRDVPPDDTNRDRELGRDQWDERPRRRKTRSTLWIWLVLATVLGGGCICCGGFIALFIHVENPTLQGFDSVDGRFHAEFPSEPMVTQRPENGVIYHTIDSQREFPVENYFVDYWDLEARPVGEAAIRMAFDDAVIRFLKRFPGGTQESRTSSVHDGYPATDLYVSHPDGIASVVRFILDGRRMYAVGISGPGLAPNSQRLERFRQAFKINPIAVPLGKQRPPGRKGK
jgi:hypothetical protein